MKAALKTLAKALVVYSGGAIVYDRLFKPQAALKRARKAADRLNLPLLIIGHSPPTPSNAIHLDLAESPQFPLPLPDDSIGVILFINAIEHEADPLALAAEAERLLAPEGTIYAMTPSPYTLHAWLGPKWALFDIEDGQKRAVPTPLYRLERAAKPATLAATPAESAPAV